jgi:hypothetical protein
MIERILISEDIEIHNALIQKIIEGGFYIIQSGSQSDKKEHKLGHIHKKDPKPEDPKFGNEFVPIGYSYKGIIFLVNKEYPKIREYHDQLRRIIGEFMSS